jgi:DNA invertase Pin-like site-specific DNA recombinase
LQEYLRTSGDGASVDEFLSKLIEERLANFKALRIRPRVECVFKKEGEIVRHDFRVHSRQLTPVDVQTILHLRYTEALPLTQIARRFGTGSSTVARVINEYETRKHHPSAVQPGPNREFEKWS